MRQEQEQSPWKAREKGGLLTEGELLERAAGGLGPQEVDHEGLDDDPAAVDEEELPADIAEADGVDVGSEELRRLAEELEDGDAAGALGVREDFDQVGWEVFSR